MKLLINGDTVSDIVKYRISSNRAEITLTIDDLNRFDKFIGHIKKNKGIYLKLVALFAITIDSGTLIVLASGSLESGLSSMATSIVGKLIIVAKYACMGMGLKEMIICLLNGGNMREASFAGVQYWLGFLFLQFYPNLYEFKF